MGGLKDFDCSFDETQLHDLLQSQGQVTTPLFMNTAPLETDLPAATLYITVDWDLGTYDVYRVYY